MLLNLLLSTAFAGKLATGLFGVPWTEPPAVAPLPSCAEQALGWSCTTTVADVPVEVAYLVEHGTLYAVSVQARGAACQTVQSAYNAAWGEAQPSNPYRTAWTEDHVWRDGPVSAIWQYNPYSGLCTILALHQRNHALVQDAKKIDAARAAGGL